MALAPAPQVVAVGVASYAVDTASSYAPLDAFALVAVPCRIRGPDSVALLLVEVHVGCASGFVCEDCVSRCFAIAKKFPSMACAALSAGRRPA